MKKLHTILSLLVLLYGCNSIQKQEANNNSLASSSSIRVILDTDANNEIDDQHAIAYMLFNRDVFDVTGITVNRTFNGGELAKHVEEANRVVTLCGMNGKIDIYAGADAAFDEIDTEEPNHDGAAAVDFIISEAKASAEEKLTLVPIGKLANIALALKKAPEIADHIRIVWLGSNYPEPGEYNQDNDTASLNFILDTDVPFEMVTVRYGKASGSDAVRATPEDIETKMAGSGPQISEAVTGRHGGSFHNFGDYASSLFEHIDLHGDPPSRALFDVVALAILKNPSWGQKREIPAPKLIDNQWIERPDNSRKIILWENFDAEAILDDFFESMNKG